MGGGDSVSKDQGPFLMAAADRWSQIQRSGDSCNEMALVITLTVASIGFTTAKCLFSGVQP